MVPTKRVLTVTYGTFSCSLEGFDDPFTAMTEIAEYFRSLAERDRFFGAEPPTPDLAELQRITANRTTGPVRAEGKDGHIVLRPERDVAAAAPSAAQPEAETAAPDEAAASQVYAPSEEEAPEFEAGSAEVASHDSESAPQIAETPDMVGQDASDVRAGSIAADDIEAGEMAEMPSVRAMADPTLASIVTPPAAFLPRAEAAPAAVAEVPRWDTDAPELVGSEISNVEPVIGENAAEAAEMDEAAPDGGGEVAAASMTEEEDLFEAAFVEMEDDREDQADESEALADEAAALLEASTAEPVEDMADADDAEVADYGEITAAEAEAEPSDVAEEPAEAEDAQALDLAARAADGEDDHAQAADGDDADDDYSDARDEVVPEVSADILASLNPAEVDPEEGARAAQALDDRIAADLAALFSKAGGTDEAEAPTKARTDAAEADDEGEAADMVARLAARDYGRKPEAEAAPEDAGEETAPEPVETAEMPSDDADDAAIAARMDDDAPEAAEKDEASDVAAPPKEPLGIPAAGTDLERLFAATDSRLAGDTEEARRTSIAHLRAAVAARRADDTIRLPDKEDESEAYRADLAKTVKPKTVVDMQLDQSEDEAPEDVPEPISPLVLVSAQRVKTEALPPEPEAVEPAAAQAERVAKTRIADPSEDFEQFAEEVGAITLTEVLEAAAVYSVTIMGQKDFSRPRLLHLAAEAVDDLSREDGLRGFGQLLREGTLTKVSRGTFTLGAPSRFQESAERRAG